MHSQVFQIHNHNEASMVPGLATNKFTKHQILIILWNNHYYLNFNGGQISECT